MSGTVQRERTITRAAADEHFAKLMAEHERTGDPRTLRTASRLLAGIYRHDSLELDVASARHELELTRAA